MLVTLWTSKGEQVDLNLREDVTIGQLRQVLVKEFNYAPNVQIMYSTRMCRDDTAVDDYPPGTLIIIGQRNATPQQATQYHTSPQTGQTYDPYRQHSSSGGATLRTGHSGGMRAAAEKKYADDYSAAASSANNRFASSQQPSYNSGGNLGSPYASALNRMGGAQPQQQQQQTYNSAYQQQQTPQPQQYFQQQQTPVAPAGVPPSPSSNYSNYLSSAAARGAASPQQAMGGWDRARSPQSAHGSRPAYATTNNGTYGAQQQPSNTYNSGNGGYGATPMRNTSAGSPLYSPNPNEQHTNQSTYNNAQNSNQNAAPLQKPATPSSPLPPPTTAATTATVAEEPAFPDVTLTAQIIGQGAEKTLPLRISGGSSVSELITMLVDKASEMGVALRPSQDSMKLMFFNKYIQNWSDPIRKVPLLDGAIFLVCTGHLVDETAMTLHSAERAMDHVRDAIDECRTLGEIPMPTNKRNHYGEQLMRALLNLDSLQGVEEDIRQRRKALVKEVTALQDHLATI